MRLNELGLNTDEEIEITGLATDSSKVRDGYVFFCLVGRENDGHTFAADALGRGAVALVVDRKSVV